MTRAALLALLCLLSVGCAAHKPASYRFRNCKVVSTETDREGNERKGCDCLRAKEVGIDAKTKAKMLWCE